MTLPPLRLEEAESQCPQQLDVPPDVRLGKHGFEGIDHPGAKESHSEARDLHYPTEHAQRPHACGPHVCHAAQCGPVTLTTVSGIQIKGVEEKSLG